MREREKFTVQRLPFVLLNFWHDLRLMVSVRVILIIFF
jgi:hypothetical protein